MARATKLTQEQKDEILKLRNKDNMSYGALAKRFGVSSMTIMRICNPEYYERQKLANREYQKQNSEYINERRRENSRNWLLSFHVKNDREVIDFLDKQNNVQDYVRQKVFADIQHEKEGH